MKRLSAKMPRKRWQKATVALGLIRKNSGSQMIQLASLQVYVRRSLAQGN